MIIVKHTSRTKRAWVTFFNEEAEKALRQYIKACKPKGLMFGKTRKLRSFLRARKKTGIHIAPKVLRKWFACEMGRLGVPDRYIDAFCGKVPKTVIARYYTDYSPERLKEIYDKAGIRVLS